MIQPVNGFRVEYATDIEAPRERVFDAMVDIGKWFPHRFKAGAPYVQEYGLGARGYEDFGNDEGALFSITTFMKRPEVWSVMQMPGIFGMYMGFSTHRFEETPAGTRLSVSLFCFGDVTEQNAAMYENGYGPIFAELKKYLANG